MQIREQTQSDVVEWLQTSGMDGAQGISIMPMRANTRSGAMPQEIGALHEQSVRLRSAVMASVHF